MYALLATLLFLFTQEVTSVHVQHKLSVRGDKTSSTTGTDAGKSASASSGTSKSADKSDDDKTTAYTVMAIGGALLVGAVGWYVYSGMGMAVYGLLRAQLKLRLRE